jgi:hypothetical protein
MLEKVLTAQEADWYEANKTFRVEFSTLKFYSWPLA